MKRVASAKVDKTAKQLRLTSFFVVPCLSNGKESVVPVLAEAAASTDGNRPKNVVSPAVHVSPKNSSTSGYETLDPVPAATTRNSPTACQVSVFHGRKFKEEWLKDLKWLNFDKSTEIAQCTVCAEFPLISDGNSKVVKGFNGPFKLETFKKHQKSFQHEKCMEANHVKSSPQSAPLAKCVKKMDDKMFRHLKTAFNIAYYIAKNNKPFSDIKELLLLADKLDVQVGIEYNNHKSCKEFVSHIAFDIQKELISEMQDQDFVSLLLDGSTDNAGVEELILYARYIKDKMVKEVFLAVLPLENATADGYLTTIEQELESLGLSKWFSSNRLVGIGTDGAASMVGVENGLVRKIQERLDHLIGVHCIAHRLNLSVLSAVKNVKSLDEIDAVLRALYKFYQNSPKRMGQLKKVSEILESKLLKFQYLHSVRWVASKVGALTALIKDWKCVVIHLESVTTEKGDSSAVAVGLLKKLKDFKFVLMLHFILDFLTVFKRLSLLFQRQQLIISTVDINVKRAISTLKTMKTMPGLHEDTFVSGTTLKGIYQEMQLQGLGSKATASFETAKQKLLDCGVEYLEERFLKYHDQSVQKCTRVFDTFTWPKGKEIADYGNEDITTLGLHFQKQLATPNLNSEDLAEHLLTEWFELKAVGQGLKMNELLNRVLSSAERFPFLSKLLCIVSVLPVSTVCCERGFSLMNLIKNKFRSSLQIESLNDLMMINMNGPELKEFDPTTAVDHWYFGAKTTRHIHGHKRTPRAPKKKKDLETADVTDL